jgi:hypothetical protein
VSTAPLHNRADALRPVPVVALDEAWFDQEVGRTADIDRFCSSSAWILSASETLMPSRTPYILRSERGVFAGAFGRHPAGFTYIEALELSWGLACPILTHDAPVFALELAAHLEHDRRWRVLLLPGMMQGSPLARTIERALPAAWERRTGPATVRQVADLDGGVDGFLSRRSRDFRKAARRAQTRACQRGVELRAVVVTSPSEADVLFARMLAIEARSWKARDGVGLSDPAFAEFYRRMCRRLAGPGRLRAIIARVDGADAAYCLGAVFAGEYRGLQFSYDDALADLSLGSLCQLDQIARLCAEGVTSYDLGTDMEYKRRWAERAPASDLLVVVRS